MTDDFRGVKPLSKDAVSAIERAKAGIAEHGVSAVVRVIGESVLGSMQFNRVGDQDYDVFEVETLEDAHDVLDDQYRTTHHNSVSRVASHAGVHSRCYAVRKE